MRKLDNLFVYTLPQKYIRVKSSDERDKPRLWGIGRNQDGVHRIHIWLRNGSPFP
jgi:hypothetical protein